MPSGSDVLAPSTSERSVRAADESKCTTGCFRPVGLQWDKEGNNLYVASDTSGELFLIRKETPSSFSLW